ncbi:hypothetical protein P691DRAFT_689037, partial [Macrolepiota fuliginosa MF-IS2]
KEDTGHISQMGLSAGSLSHGMMDWVRNICLWKKNLAEHEAVNYDASLSFTVLWGLVWTLLPTEVLADFDNFIQWIGPDLCMDSNKTMEADTGGHGTYHINIGHKDLEYHQAELAPPVGVMAENYCWYIHNENQPHKWAVSLTTSCTSDPDVPSVDAGGHFYIASYGLHFQASPNTLIAWHPADWHGTSLLHIDPLHSSKEYHQQGLCIVTPIRLPDAVKKWREGKIGREEMEKMANDYHPEHELDKPTHILQMQVVAEAPSETGDGLHRSVRLTKKKCKYWNLDHSYSPEWP